VRTRTHSDNLVLLNFNIVLITMSIALTLVLSQTFTGQAGKAAPFTPEQERLKDILREEGDKAFYKQCSNDLGGHVLFLCDTMKDILKQAIANETKIDSLSGIINSSISETYIS
jgi:hypothetical protein